ncbi:MAG TPA: hypothetical protein VE054_00670 [Blattabacteriaceae bacterium]|nr:hypothetical protein [Blattabacteriaceae bacterium]
MPDRIGNGRYRLVNRPGHHHFRHAPAHRGSSTAPLPLARTIVEGMGGRLTASSELGKGSAFTIHLPVAQERKAEETHGAADKPADAEPGFSR